MITAAAHLPVCAQPARPAEYHVKAAFLYNFGKFVDWPPDAFADAHSAFSLCVAGREAFERARESLTGKSIRGRELDIRQIAALSAAERCHIVFVATDVGHADDGALARLAASHALTVGESADFIARGGIVNLVRTDNRIRFEIDRPAGERAGFRFSAQLLKLATLVEAAR